MSLEQASEGFPNQGQFLAALNASKNRGLSFTELRDAMVNGGLSLGEAARTIPSAQPTEPEVSVTVTTGTEGGTTTGGTTTGGTTTGGTTTGGTTTGGTTTGGTTTGGTTTGGTTTGTGAGSGPAAK
jgi:hypothetical protein